MNHIARSHSDDYQILVRSADRTDIANLKWLQEKWTYRNVGGRLSYR